MTISLKKAFKAPFEKGFLFPCTILYINALLFTTVFMLTPITTICIFSAGLLCQLILLGYQLSFSHNAVRQTSPLFHLLSLNTIGYGLKSVIFGLLCYVFLGIMAVPVYLSALFKIPFWLFSFILIFELLFTFLYLMTAWTKFTDNGNVLQPLKMIDTTKWLALNWRSYLKITLYMILAIVILTIPVFAIKFISALGVMYNTLFIYGHIFVLAVIQLYATFVILHLMAQGYTGIKARMNALSTESLVTVKTQATPLPPKQQTKRKIPTTKKTAQPKKSKVTKQTSLKKKTAKTDKKAK